MITVLSDLHLGIGDEREDFLVWGENTEGPKAEARLQATASLDEKFARFLAHQLALANQSGLRPMLLLLGDTFDFWQARRKGEKPVDTLTKILSVHVEFVVALRHWISVGGEITLVVGNHDQALVEENTWNRLREILPTLNQRVGGKPVHSFSDEASGLYAEHGHRWDPWNQVRKLDRWDACSVGRLIVEEVVNRLEPEFPIIDKMGSIADVLQFLEQNLEASRRQYVWRHLRRILRSRSTLVKLLHPWSEGKQAPLQKLQDQEIAKMNNGIERALRPRPGGTTGPVPVNFRFFACGHTHESLRVSTRAGVERFNPGTWTPLVDLNRSRLTVTQHLPYGVITPGESGDWQLRLGSFAKEDRE